MIIISFILGADVSDHTVQLYSKLLLVQKSIQFAQLSDSFSRITLTRIKLFIELESTCYGLVGWEINTAWPTGNLQWRCWSSNKIFVTQLQFLWSCLWKYWTLKIHPYFVWGNSEIPKGQTRNNFSRTLCPVWKILISFPVYAEDRLSIEGLCMFAS